MSLLNRDNVTYSNYGVEITLDMAKDIIGFVDKYVNGECVKTPTTIHVLETPISFIYQGYAETYFYSTVKYISEVGYVFERKEDDAQWDSVSAGKTIEFEDGTIWTAPKEEPNKALMEFILQRQTKSVVLDEDEDFVV